MSIVEVKVPQLSESVAEATLLQWKKKPGEAVAIDEILIEIETDKVVAKIDREGRAVAAAPAAPAGAAAAAPAVAAAAGGSKAGIAMPAAAKIMADNKMATGSVPGTGR